jgi:fumarate hydratase subunit alpha
LNTIDEKTLSSAALELVRRSSTGLAPDVLELLRIAHKREDNAPAKTMLATMIKNAELATSENKPICQSPGYPVVYAKLGGNVALRTPLQKVFQDALIDSTKSGYLRPSIVDPITRRNSGDNSGIGVPDVELEYLPDSNYLELVISFKGCGAELANVAKVLMPSEVGADGSGIKKLVLESMINAGGIPCPPVGIGIGIGGQTHYAAKLSRRAIGARRWNDTNLVPQLDALEKDLLSSINGLGIGPAGVGGRTTTLAVKVEAVSTHTAICPVAINFHCWVARRCGARIYADKRVEYFY